MTTKLLHPDDSGECARLLGETRTRIDLGEPTQRIDPRLIKAPSFDAIPRRVVDIDDTVIYMPATIGLAGPQDPPPPRPLPNPGPPPKPTYAAETERISLLGSVAGIDGELRPSDYVGRHRHAGDLDEGGEYWEFQRPAHERRLSPWWALAGVVVAGLTIWAGLYLAGAAVIW